MMASKDDDKNEKIIEQGPAEFWVADDMSRVYLIFQPETPSSSRRTLVRSFVEIAISLACQELGLTRAQLLGVHASKSDLAQA